MMDDFSAHAAALSGNVPSYDASQYAPPQFASPPLGGAAPPAPAAAAGSYGGYQGYTQPPGRAFADSLSPLSSGQSVPQVPTPPAMGSLVSGGGPAAVQQYQQQQQQQQAQSSPGGGASPAAGGFGAAAAAARAGPAGGGGYASAMQLGANADMVPFTASHAVGTPSAGAYATNVPSVVSVDAVRGVCSLQMHLVKRSTGFGFTLSQFSLYEAHKNTVKSINLEPLAKKCRFADGGLPVVDIEAHGAAATAGVRQWDVIVDINGTDIRGLTAKESIAKLKEQQSENVTIQIMRSGPPPSDLASLAHGTIQQYGSMMLSPFVSSAPPLEKVKTADGNWQVKMVVTKNAHTGWGFTPFKFSMVEMKRLTSWHQTLRKGEWDVGALRKKCKFAKATGGLPIQYVKHGGAGHAAGMLPWDVIIEINGRSVREDTAEQIADMFRQAPTESTITVLRSPNPPGPAAPTVSSPSRAY